MTEADAKEIALRFVAQSTLDPCKLTSIRFIAGDEDHEVGSTRNEWVALFEFELPEDVDTSTEFAMVLVDDVTGEARHFETL